MNSRTHAKRPRNVASATLPRAPGSARLTPAERTWVKKAIRQHERDVCYYTIADARNWLDIVRKINVRIRTASTTTLAHRVENAGQYLAVKRYVADMVRLTSPNTRDDRRRATDSAQPNGA